MTETALRIRRLINLMRERGHLAPDHATASASKLLEAEPLVPGFAFVAASLVRHAAVLAPFDREKRRLAKDVNAPMRHNPFDDWLWRADDLTHSDPVPENVPMPADSAALVTYIEAQPANELRLPALLRLRRLGDNERFQAGVQLLSGSPSGLLAGPIMAWQAHFLNEELLAQMLLDEGVLSFPALNLRGLLAIKAGNLDEGRRQLIDSLEEEPFQPAIIELLANGISKDTPARLEALHDKLGQPMSLEDVEKVNDELKNDVSPHFPYLLAKVLPSLRANATVFWQTLALSLR